MDNVWENHKFQNVVSHDLYTLSFSNLEKLLVRFTPTNNVKLRNDEFVVFSHIIYVIAQKGQLLPPLIDNVWENDKL